MLVCKAFGNRVHDGALYGMEVEVEFANDFPTWIRSTPVGEYKLADRGLIPFWSPVLDGSLRNGIEFISAHPMTEDELSEGIDLLWDKLEAVNPTPKHTPRTSIHIHTNVSDLTLQHAGAFLFIWAVVEEVITKQMTPRWLNNFCYSFVKARGAIDTIINLLNDDNHVALRWKYTALNVLPIVDKGTLEMRIFPFSINRDEIKTFVKVPAGIRKFVSEFDAASMVKWVMDTADKLADGKMNAKGVIAEVFGEGFAELFDEPINTGCYAAEVISISNIQIPAEEVKKPKPKSVRIGNAELADEIEQARIAWNELRMANRPFPQAPVRIRNDQ